MNFLKLIQEIEKVDAEVYERLDSRRGLFSSFGSLSKKAAVAALPIAFGTSLKKAYAGTSAFTTIGEILNYALTLEHTENEFYKQGLAATGLAGTLTGAARTAIQQIQKHEAAHVAVLTATLNTLNVTPVAKPNFDFTGSKNGANAPLLADVFTNYDSFLALAQGFEDTGVRAYKGQANNQALMANNEVLTAALQIHSVEARHAAHLRMMRKARGGAASVLKPWIENEESGGLPAWAQGIYAGEGTTTQAGVPITGLPGNISAADASEAFDEPLDETTVLAIAGNFIY